MKRNVIAMIIAAAMTAGLVSPASVHAVEIVSQDAETAQEETGQETGQSEVTEETDEEHTEAPEETAEAEAAESAEETVETESAEETAEAQAEAAAEETEETIFTAIIEPEEETVFPSDTDDVSSEEMFSDYVDRSFNGDPISASAKDKKYAYSSLSGYELGVYNYLATQIPLIASGERASTIMQITPEIMGMEQTSWTAEDLGVDSIWTLDEDGNIVKNESGKGVLNPEAVAIVRAKTAYNVSVLLDALLADYPYDLYWYQKKAGTHTSSFGFATSYNSTTKTYSLKISKNMTLSFSVADDYAVSQYEIDTTVGQTVQNSVQKAQDIVSKYSDASDLEILRGYKNEICDLVSYNYSAASGGASYGNPWQMIWVFDDDPDTKVVCEGYSKAFKYLCDQTDFEAEIDCIITSGTMESSGGSAGHMWNTVSMDDGRNYLVDVTNCDSSSGGSDRLFLVGSQDQRTNDDGESGYYFSSVRLGYYYDEETTGIFREADLKLCGHNYGAHVFGTEYTVLEEATCTEDGSGEGDCAICGDHFTGVIPATGHSYGSWEIVKIATCTEAGSKKKVCSGCGNEITASISATGHLYSDWEVTLEPTCTAEGSREKTCSRCGDKIVEAIPMTEHTWNEEYTVDEEATCAKEGSESIHCADCGTIKEGTSRVIPKTDDHVYGDWEVTLEPTCTEEGSKEKTCSVCGDVAEEVIPAAGHKWDTEYTIDKEATGLEEGSMSIHCTVCDVIDESTVQVIPVLAGEWIENHKGWWYRWVDGTYPAGMLLEINGKSFYFDESGYIKTSWQQIDGEWYYFAPAPSGAMQTGWLQLNGKWYYLGTDGILQTGRQQINGKQYYFAAAPSGVMQTGWQKIDGFWYYFNSNGAMQTGWQKIGYKWYYFDSEGVMKTGWQEINGKWYYFAPGGAMQTGWQKIGVRTYYFAPGGAMQTGWQKIDGDWYYFAAAPSGAMQTGWLQINGKWYYFTADGKMVTGTLEINGKSYTFNSNGALQ